MAIGVRESTARAESAIDLRLIERCLRKMNAEEQERVALLDAHGDLRERLLNWRVDRRLDRTQERKEEIAQRHERARASPSASVRSGLAHASATVSR